MKWLEPKPVTKSVQIVKMMTKLESIPSGSEHHRASKALQRFCLNNPEAVVEIAFDNSIDTSIQEKIVLLWSRDHSGSCDLNDNPVWTKMMREFIIPRLNDLPSEFIRGEIAWYEQVHGL